MTLNPKIFLFILFTGLFLGCEQDRPYTELECLLTVKSLGTIDKDYTRHLYEYNEEGQLVKVSTQRINQEDELVTREVHSIFYNELGQITGTQSSDGWWSYVHYDGEKIKESIHTRRVGGSLQETVNKYVYEGDKLKEMQIGSTKVVLDWKGQNIVRITQHSGWTAQITGEFLHHDNNKNARSSDFFRVFLKNGYPQYLTGLSANNAICHEGNTLPETLKNFCQFSYNEQGYPITEEGRVDYYPYYINYEWRCDD